MDRTVVIVDDTAFMRLRLKNMLETLGYEVLAEGENGYDAVSMYKQFKPAVITMDITMPKKDGIEAVKEIMAYDSQANIIMISAMGQKAKVVDAISAGARDFVVKPFQPERVSKAMSRLEKLVDESGPGKKKKKKPAPGKKR